jgi:hypothetical protein
MLPSPWSIKYFEALAREGDKFDFDAWLARMRQEEALERGEPISGVPVSPVLSRGPNAVSERSELRRPPRHVSKLNWRRRYKAADRPREPTPSRVDDALRDRLSKVCDVWDTALEDRSRDSIYRYLKAVYSLVTRCRREGREKELLCYAISYANLAVSENSELFATVIRSTCDGKLDAKSVSKFSRALRYAAYRDRPPRMLIAFIKKRGGINGAARLYAKNLGRGLKSK